MNIRRLWVRLVLLFVVAAVAGYAIPTTLAYVAARSSTLYNTFGAPYFTPESTSVEVSVHKTVHNVGTETISPEGFQFALVNTQNGETITLTANENGFDSAALYFSDADIGKTCVYHLYEVNDGRAGVTYSEKVYTIEITLSVNADNQVVASVTVDGQPVQQIAAEFENICNVGIAPPPTGDATPVALYMALALTSAAAMAILLMRRKGRAVS